MRMHIELDDELVARLDEVAGTRGRSSFVRSAIESALDEAIRWQSLKSAAGALAVETHDWDADAAAWVRQQRHEDPKRAG